MKGHQKRTAAASILPTATEVGTTALDGVRTKGSGAEARTGTLSTVNITARAKLDDAEIATRAYSYWEARGFQAGCPEEDWYRAIMELTAEGNS
jgi:hypothetical protein